MLRRLAFSLCLSLTLAACAGEEGSDELPDEILPLDMPSKEDGAGRAGPAVATNTTATQVWTARNKWEDRDTTAARRAGVAWGENSGLNWDEKYVKWIESMEVVNSTSGYHTIKVTTPWNKTVVAPVLECAETAIVLRATFAAWYELPFFMEAQIAGGTRLYFGHFGIRQGTAKYANTPNFATAYRDYSAAPPSTWPRDAALRGKHADGGDDEQVIEGGGPFGAWLDEVHLNKRAGHLIIYLVNYFGSMNLSDSANTYNIKPASLRSADLLIHRWQRSGIGDAKMTKKVEAVNGKLVAHLMSGSMPRRQPKIYDDVASKGYFTSNDTGGVGENSDGDTYYSLRGGAKRWRVTKNVGGFWTNTWMAADEASWVNDTNQAAITARPAQFHALLEEVPPEEKAAALRAQIDDARAHLLRYPASCAARERRERAFTELYALAPQLGKTKAQLDGELRTPDDYVFAALDYTHAKTCCWNSSSAEMADIILDYAEKERAEAAAAMQCRALTVFRSEAGTGYGRWQQYAEQTGRALAWRAWSEDESCPQRAEPEDRVAAFSGTAYCSLPTGGSGGGGGSCTDDHEPNNSAAAAKNVTAGQSYTGRICSADQDFFAVTVGAGGSINLSVTLGSGAGDLDVELLSPTGTRVNISQTTGSLEQITATGLSAGRYVVRVYGYQSATGPYTLRL
jgi:hypothetical protein